MIEFQDEDDTNGIRQAYCGVCRDVVTVDAEGCTECADDGVISRPEPVTLELVPPSSPRAHECPTCGTDPGEFCYPGADGTGHNHDSRVELVEGPEELVVRELGKPDRTIQTKSHRGRR